jgi:hypothetical protein
VAITDSTRGGAGLGGLAGEALAGCPGVAAAARRLLDLAGRPPAAEIAAAADRASPDTAGVLYYAAALAEVDEAGAGRTGALVDACVRHAAGSAPVPTAAHLREAARVLRGTAAPRRPAADTAGMEPLFT